MPVNPASISSGAAWNFERDLTRHHDELAEQGYTIVEDLIPADLIAALRNEVARLEAELGRQPGNNRFEGAHTVRTWPKHI